MSNKRIREALESLRQKFTSGNDVPVTEARITRAEYEALAQPTEEIELTDDEVRDLGDISVGAYIECWDCNGSDESCQEAAVRAVLAAYKAKRSRS